MGKKTAKRATMTSQGKKYDTQYSPRFLFVEGGSMPVNSRHYRHLISGEGLLLPLKN